MSLDTKLKNKYLQYVPKNEKNKLLQAYMYPIIFNNLYVIEDELLHFQIMYHKITEISDSNTEDVNILLMDIAELLDYDFSGNVELDTERYSITISVPIILL